MEPKAAERVRGDSFVVETNIHYPTDSSLIADGLRKVPGLAVQLAALFGLFGWRQHKHLYRKARRLVRTIDRIAARKGDGYYERMKRPSRELLEVAGVMLTRAETLRETVRKYGEGGGAEALALDKDLVTFLERTRRVCELARRRVLQGETIPNSEKLFSIFETHTQLYKRGKAGEPTQFGRLVLVLDGLGAHPLNLPKKAPGFASGVGNESGGQSCGNGTSIVATVVPAARINRPVQLLVKWAIAQGGMVPLHLLIPPGPIP